MTKTDFQKDIIAELHKSENTNSSNLDAKISFLIIFGQTKRSRMLKDATHRSSTSFLVFTLIQIVRQTGISPLKHQIFSFSYLNRCWFSQLWPCYNCFHLLWVLGAVQRSHIWNIYHYLRLVHDLSCWSSWNKPTKEFFFLSWLPWKIWIRAILVSKSQIWPALSPYGTSIAL